MTTRTRADSPVVVSSKYEGEGLTIAQGLTKRELFAALALAGLLADPNMDEVQDAVKTAVATADILINALNLRRGADE